MNAHERQPHANHYERGLCSGSQRGLSAPAYSTHPPPPVPSSLQDRLPLDYKLNLASLLLHSAVTLLAIVTRSDAWTLFYFPDK